MNEIKIEIVKLLKFPIIGLTIVFVVFSLGIDMSNIKDIGPNGVAFFHPGTLINSTEKKDIIANNNLDVSLPKTSSKVIEKVSNTIYSSKPTSTGWVYLGTYKNGAWRDRLIEISEFLIPEINKSYVIVADSVAVRAGKPKFPFYGLKERVGFAKKDDLVKVILLDSDLGKNRVWAKIEVYSKT